MLISVLFFILINFRHLHLYNRNHFKTSKLTHTEIKTSKAPNEEDLHPNQDFLP